MLLIYFFLQKRKFSYRRAYRPRQRDVIKRCESRSKRPKQKQKIAKASLGGKRSKEYFLFLLFMIAAKKKHSEVQSFSYYSHSFLRNFHTFSTVPGRPFPISEQTVPDQPSCRVVSFTIIRNRPFCIFSRLTFLQSESFTVLYKQPLSLNHDLHIIIIVSGSTVSSLHPLTHTHSPLDIDKRQQ